MIEMLIRITIILEAYGMYTKEFINYKLNSYVVLSQLTYLKITNKYDKLVFTKRRDTWKLQEKYKGLFTKTK